jgi:hypothetical protein
MISIYSLNYHVNGVADNDANKEAISNTCWKYTEYGCLLSHVLYDSQQEYRMNFIFTENKS